MEKAFWQSRWNEGRTAFHEGAPNRHLTRHFGALSLAPGSHVFVPLSGKSVDLDWLLAQGCRVSGIEFNREAVAEVFDRLGLLPEITETAGLTRYETGDLVLWVGDFFELTPQELGAVDAVYDRAALVALPAQKRQGYVTHLQILCPLKPQLLVSYDYDQAQTEGPPFSVPRDTIFELYADLYDIRQLESVDISGPLASRCTGKEQAWLLQPVQTT